MIRDQPAIDCARELLKASGSTVADSDVAIRCAATFIQNCVLADELGQELERKQSVLTLIRGGKPA